MATSNDNEFTIEFAKIMKGISVNYGVELTMEYLEFLQDMFETDRITINKIKQAARILILTKSVRDLYGRMPGYDEFIKIIKPDKNQLAEEEAQKIIDLIRSVGSSEDPELSQQTKNIINSRFGGWKNLCRTLEESKIQWFIRDFKEAYLSAVKYQERVMIGRNEAEELIRKIGFKPKK